MAVREALTNASAHGFRVLQGTCFDRDQALPYAPFLDSSWRAFATAQPDEVRTLLRSRAPGFLRLLPELGDASTTAVATLTAEQEQRRFFHEIAALTFTALAAEQPLLVLIEDVHWSDETSLELLLFLARRAATIPLVLLVTYRSDDRGIALDHILAWIDRERLASETKPTPRRILRRAPASCHLEFAASGQQLFCPVAV